MRMSPSATLAVLAAAGVALIGCAPTSSPPASAPSATPTPARPTPAPPPPAGAIVEPVTAADLGASWHPGCPVMPAQLRRIRLSHIGFDDQPRRGELIVHEKLVSQGIAIFEQLYRLHYPIEKMRPVGHYPGAADELSMEDNNTSAFNCREIPGTGRWAQHAYGRAVDLNPLLNPSIDGIDSPDSPDSGAALQPRNAGGYLNRGRTDPGLLHDGDAAVRAFTSRGWRWGGHWKTPVDYQHFEQPR